MSMTDQDPFPLARHRAAIGVAALLLASCGRTITEPDYSRCTRITVTIEDSTQVRVRRAWLCPEGPQRVPRPAATPALRERGLQR